MLPGGHRAAAVGELPNLLAALAGRHERCGSMMRMMRMMMRIMRLVPGLGAVLSSGHEAAENWWWFNFN